MREAGKYTYTPTEEFCWFAEDPSDSDKVFFRTEEEAVREAEAMIETHLDDGWDEDVDRILVGKITHHTVKVNAQHRPKREDFETELDFLAAVDDYPDMDYEYSCMYEPRPLNDPGEKL